MLYSLDFDKIPIDSIEIETFEKLEQLMLVACSGSKAKLKLILRRYDQLKLKIIIFCPNMKTHTESILTFIANRFVNLKDLWIVLNKTTAE